VHMSAFGGKADMAQTGEMSAIETWPARWTAKKLNVIRSLVFCFSFMLHVVAALSKWRRYPIRCCGQLLLRK
jgi:hypothetical protein